jgi:hypothetical protein
VRGSAVGSCPSYRASAARDQLAALPHSRQPLTTVVAAVSVRERVVATNGQPVRILLAGLPLRYDCAHDAVLQASSPKEA